MIVCLISAYTEWDVTKELLVPTEIVKTPYGESFTTQIQNEDIVFLHGGIGKIDAASSCQYAISKHAPELVLNLGTCGGFRGKVENFELCVVEKSVVYDLIERMFDPNAIIDHYKTALDLRWTANLLANEFRRITIATADQDLDSQMIVSLFEKYGAVAADWESGAIARVANRNNVRCLILRGVSDLVGVDGAADAYGDKNHVWKDSAKTVMSKLIEALPVWLQQHQKTRSSRF